jgi:hypothetical protein
VGEVALCALVTDFLRKKKSRLAAPAMADCCARAPQLALSPASMGVVLHDAAGGARNAFKQVWERAWGRACVLDYPANHFD